MKTTKKLILGALVVAATSAQAWATPMMKVTASGGGAGLGGTPTAVLPYLNTSVSTGTATFNVFVNGFGGGGILNVAPQITRTAGSGTQIIEVWMTDTDLTDPFASFTIDNAVIYPTGGTGSVQLITYYDNTNTAFGTQNILQSFSPVVTPGVISQGPVVAGASPTAPFSITQRLIFTINNNGKTYQAQSNITPTPEPGSIILFSSSALAIGFLMWRKQRAANRA